MQDIITDNRIFNIQMVQGDSFSFGMKITGIGQDLDTAYFTCKQTKDTSTKLFQKSIGNGITKDTERSTGDDRYYKVRIAPADTVNLHGRYYYDFKIGTNSDVFTILTGVLDIEQSVGV